MSIKTLMIYSLVLLTACATEYSVLDEYEQVPATPMVKAPESTPESVSDNPQNAKTIAHGKYMVELLGCGGCHTDGALVGLPDSELALAGSSIGIAHSNPLQVNFPGVVFPPNLTPDVKTGIGGYSDAQLRAAIRGGDSSHGYRKLRVMPVVAYAHISDDDIDAITDYLRSLTPTAHRIPTNVPEGIPTDELYVHFGVYRSRER